MKKLSPTETRKLSFQVESVIHSYCWQDKLFMENEFVYSATQPGEK